MTWLCRLCEKMQGMEDIAINGMSHGSTRILRWPGARKAAFLLMFDDNAPTMVTNVIPELIRREMTGTFYINPGNQPYILQHHFWEHPLPGIEYANHTFSHVGAWDEKQLDEEIQKCQEVIFQCYPARSVPRLVSFGRPGGVPWTIDPDAEARVFAKHNLIERPPYKGYPFQFSSNDEILSLVDSALESGTMEYVAYHGIGGDWHPTPTEWFLALLDKLDQHREDIWITDPISWHKYSFEREGAHVFLLCTTPDKFFLRLDIVKDSTFYDMPLTLETRVPKGWAQCEVCSNGRIFSVKADAGMIRYEATAGDIQISLIA